jgi:hypothetical protein
LRDIDSQLVVLRQELASAQSQEESEAKMGTMVDLALAANLAFAEYSLVREGLNTALLEWAKRLDESQAAIEAKRREFIRTFAEIVPSAHMHPNWSHPDPLKQQQLEQRSAELTATLRARGADLNVVLSNMFGDKSQIDTETLAQSETAKIEPFGDMLSTILKVARDYEARRAPEVTSTGAPTGMGVVGHRLGLPSSPTGPGPLLRHDHAA